MIISDLQYIETANAEVVGGTKKKYEDKIKSWKKRKPFNQAGAEATAEAFGFNTKAFTKTDTLVIEGEFSGAYSSSYSEASH